MTDRWITSSYSGDQGNCVELAQRPDATLVRDTKSRDTGTLQVPAASFRRFVRSVVADH